MADNQEVVSEYLDFLGDEFRGNVYHRRVMHLIEENGQRLLICMDDLRNHCPHRCTQLLQNYLDEEAAFKTAIQRYVSIIDELYGNKYDEFFVGFYGSFGEQHVTPRTLKSKFLGSLVCLEGVVSQRSDVNQVLSKSVHYCPATKQMHEHRHTKFTSPNFGFTANTCNYVYPTRDGDGNLLETEFGLSVFVDRQTLTINESADKTPAGQLTRSVDVLVEDDLVERCKPGDRVMIVGVYRSFLPPKGSIFFKTMIIGNNIIVKTANLSVDRSDITLCRELLAKKKDAIFDLLAHSIAPSIHGFEHVKKAIVCLLVGGVETTLPNKTRIRGDINVLLVGDPAVSKSQLLRYVVHVAPLALCTVGRGSTGVGLTAAVTTNKASGGRQLDAGAMVLADRGVLCIDEFDKMSDIDRVAMHEAMEQGSVSISKAGIHAKLNARCSVLAAANPHHGIYNQRITPAANIGMQDSLLSRFDLMFIMLDVPNRENDILISDHVIRMHRYRDPKEQDGEVLPFNSDVDVLTTNILEHELTTSWHISDVFEKHNNILHGNVEKEILKSVFLRKYLAIAKCVKPQLGNEACKIITEEFARIRSPEAVSNGTERTMPVTPRTVESLVRIGTAHAKARFSRIVEAQDARFAVDLMNVSYFQKK